MAFPAQFVLPFGAVAVFQGAVRPLYGLQREWCCDRQTVGKWLASLIVIWAGQGRDDDWGWERLVKLWLMGKEGSMLPHTGNSWGRTHDVIPLVCA